MTTEAAAPPKRNPIGISLAIAMLIALIIGPFILFGRAYNAWRTADPAAVITQLSTPPEAEVVHTFGPLPYAPLQEVAPSPQSNITEVHGLVLRSSAPVETIEAAYSAQFAEQGWQIYDDDITRAALPNGLEVMAQPYSPEALAFHFDETVTLQEGERLYIVWAWKSTLLD